MNGHSAGRKSLSPILPGVLAEIAFAIVLGLAGILICAVAIWIAGIS